MSVLQDIKGNDYLFTPMPLQQGFPIQYGYSALWYLSSVSSSKPTDLCWSVQLPYPTRCALWTGHWFLSRTSSPTHYGSTIITTRHRMEPSNQRLSGKKIERVGDSYDTATATYPTVAWVYWNTTLLIRECASTGKPFHDTVPAPSAYTTTVNDSWWISNDDQV
jgi:hypothetical protein